jgi:hypothetical protein
MANNGDWLPSREQDLADLCQKWKAGLENPANVTNFGWKQAEVTETLAKVTAFLTAREAYEEVDSTANRMAKDEAKDAAKSAMRDFANSSIRYNKQMKDEDKLVYGIRPVDRTAPPAGVPESYPEADPDMSIIWQVTINFWDSATKKRGKPHGVHGAEIRWALLVFLSALGNKRQCKGAVWGDLFGGDFLRNFGGGGALRARPRSFPTIEKRNA